MTTTSELQDRVRAKLGTDIPDPVLHVFRGIGQVFFQENALSGACFVLGIAFSSPPMAIGAVVGAAIGTAAARLLKFDASEVRSGIYGFNSALVGIATLFFFRPGVSSIALLLVGCFAAALVTWLARRYVPFPTYTAPFVVTTWALFLLGLALGAARVDPGGPPEGVGLVGASAHGVSQVMFQASIWTALLFLIGIAVSNWQHAAWVLLGAVIGALAGSFHATAAARALDPESLVERALLDNVALGLYGYNATLAAVALFLWRHSLIPPLLGILLSVPITELLPRLGMPALTAPFVLATWIVLALGWLDEKYLRMQTSPPA
jgi:urea transporter